MRLVWDLADRLAIGGQRPVVEVALVEAVALPPGKHAEEAVARGGGRIRSGGRCDAGNRILDVAIMGCQPLDRFEIGAEILVDDLIGRIRIAARRGVRRGGLYQEIARPLAQPGSRLKIEPDILGERKPHAAPQRRLGVGLAVAQLAGCRGRLLVELAVLAQERGPFPKRRGVGELLKPREIVAPPLFLDGRLCFVFEFRRRSQLRSGIFLPDIIRHRRQRQGQHAAPNGDAGQDRRQHPVQLR